MNGRWWEPDFSLLRWEDPDEKGGRLEGTLLMD